MKNKGYSKKIVWKDRKRTFFGLPWSFTRYMLFEDKLIIDTGFFSRNEDDIRLYRIMDVTLHRSFLERIFGLGTIHCCSGDKTMGEFNISHIKDSRNIKEMLSDMIEKERLERRVGVRENMGSIDDDDDFDHDNSDDDDDDDDDDDND